MTEKLTPGLTTQRVAEVLNDIQEQSLRGESFPSDPLGLLNTLLEAAGQPRLAVVVMDAVKGTGRFIVEGKE